jgi:hypothetical protein
MDNNQNYNGMDINQLLAQNKERLKELAAINHTNRLIKSGKPVDETLQQIVDLLPDAWQYPEFTCARINFSGRNYVSQKFKETKWMMQHDIVTLDDKKGFVEVYYTKEFVLLDEGPFLKEERHLIDNVASIITGYLNTLAAQQLLQKRDNNFSRNAIQLPVTSNRKLLHKFLNENNYSRDIYHDLMPFKVKEILLVGNLYDAYNIEREGRFAENVLGEYRQLNLTFTPRITGASNTEEVTQQINSKHYDMIIFFVGIDKKMPLEMSRIVKDKYPYIPVFFLLNNNNDIGFYENKKPESVDQIFVWNGDSSIFFAMIKMIEDKINVQNDTRVGMVRVILLVEDSVKFYSRLMPLLYRVVLEQTRRIIDDVKVDELYRLLRLRARPKILLANNFEDAQIIINQYREYLQCVITDLKYPMNGELNENAGYKLLDYIKETIVEMPVCIQSSEVENEFKHNHACINKNSDNYEEQIRTFINHFVGFGNFIFRDKEGHQLAVAKNLKAFENYIRVISDDSLVYHSQSNHFSMWLMARGEINLAKVLNPYKLEDFKTVVELREFLLETILKYKGIAQKGRLLPFEESVLNDERNIAQIGTGTLGGKGRGVAFINTLIYNFDFNRLIQGINIKTPRTVIIGVDVFDEFLEDNGLKEYFTIEGDIDYYELRLRFKNANLPRSLVRQLKIILKNYLKPLAIRSSSLLEDSLYQPFSGIFETYLIPNNHQNIEVRLSQFMDAIKLVYASLFSKMARGYIEAINYKLDEEKMGIVIQEVVGNQFGDVYYPHISGVAQSYNYYPVSYMLPEDGFSVMAVGLGCYVVEGEKAFRFCPKYPKIDISSLKDQYKESQLHFYAVDMSKGEINLLEGEEAGLKKLEIWDSEKHGTLKHCASVFDAENERVIPGLSSAGPRIVNFANILKYNYAPIPEAIENILEIVKEAMGSPVEIEFAVDLNKDNEGKVSLYLLQVKPLIGSASDYSVNLEEIDGDQILLKTEKAMGNGSIEQITDVVYIDLDRFDKTQTEKMAEEIEAINKQMMKEDRNYILIGPGRWGTRDKWIGIPVNWPQICNAKVIIEYGFDTFPLDPSSGSHFFHNVTSMNVGYFSIQKETNLEYIRWSKLKEQKLINSTEFFNHVRFSEPLSVKMDGKKRIAVILTDK